MDTMEFKVLKKRRRLDNPGKPLRGTTPGTSGRRLKAPEDAGPAGINKGPAAEDGLLVAN